MARQKDSTKTAKQKPEAKTEKTKRASDKTPIKTTPVKRSASSSKNKKPMGKNASAEKKGRAKQVPGKFPQRHIDGNHPSSSTKDKKFKEKLESMTAAIDSIKTATNSESRIKLQEIIRTIFTDGVFFLKSLPEIRDAKLLAGYQRLYKKIERFVKSIAFDIENIEEATVDNCCCDGNIIILEKTMDEDGVFYYRSKHSNENTLISTFNVDGRPVYHDKIYQTGEREFSFVPPSRPVFVFEGVEEEKYDEKIFTVIQSITIDRKSYGSYVGKNFDTRKMDMLNGCKEIPESLDVRVVNLLFENYEQRDILSKLKNNKIFGIKINVSNMILQNKKEYSEHGIQNNGSVLSMKNNNQTILKNDLHKPILNNSFVTGRKILLAADYGAGKNLLTIEVARLGIEKGFIKYPCFFNFEDKHNQLQQRYTDVFKEDCHIVDFATWDAILKAKAEDINERNAFIASQATGRELDKFESIKNKRNRNNGVTIKEDYRIDAFVKLVEDKIALGCDFFVLDSLNEVFSDINYYHKNLYDKLINSTMKNNFTFIIIHQLNRKTLDIQGANRLKNQFYSIYYLHKISDSSSGENGKVLKIEVVKNTLDVDDKSFLLERTKKSEFVAKYKILDENEALIYDTKGTKLTECIKKFLLIYGKEEISRIELSEHFKEVKNMTTMTNAFTELQREKFILKKDGKTWKDIIILKPN